MHVYTKTTLIVSIALILFGCQSRDSTQAEWTSYPIGKGQVTVQTPANYRQSMDTRGELVFTPPNDLGVTIKIADIGYLEGAAKKFESPDFGEQFVRDQAKKMKLPLTEKNGKVYNSNTIAFEKDGENVELFTWSVGFQEIAVHLIAVVPVSKKDDPRVKECLEKSIPRMIDSLRKS